jgi:hypothetical protein
MAAPEPGAVVAKAQGIYLGQIYAYIKKGLVVNHKVGGYPEGKGVEVDPDEVSAAMAHSRRKGGGPGKGKSGYVRKADRPARADTERPEPAKTRKLKSGTIVSYDRGRAANGYNFQAPKFTVAQVIGANGRLTFMDDGDHRQSYGGVQIDNIVFSTDHLSLLMAKGAARIEHPVPVLGMVLLSFIMEGKVELAESLEGWLIANDVPVQIPEIIDTLDEAEDDEPVRGQVITGDEDEEG